ncbi:MAG: Clp protease N-terminal domain-containing protein [Phycisphaerales bacterium]
MATGSILTPVVGADRVWSNWQGERILMFERFTEHARHVMELAGREAQRFGNEYVGTEHLLWGLAKETHGVAATVLEHFHVDLKPLRREMEEMLKSRPHVEDVEKLPQSVHVKEAIQYAVDEARSMHHNYVGTEHILLGLMRNSQAVSAQVLADFDLDLDAVREEVRRVAESAGPSEKQQE